MIAIWAGRRFCEASRHVRRFCANAITRAGEGGEAEVETTPRETTSERGAGSTASGPSRARAK